MYRLLKFGMLASALALAACGGDSGSNNAAANNAPIEPLPAPKGGDWTQTIAETPEGGFRMGNPDAPVKLVEYASLTCPHCAEFSEAATDPLTNRYVKSGRVSWEFRPYLLFPTDLGASMLLRCHGAAASFRLVEQIYADQPNWTGRMQGMSPMDEQRLQALPPAQRGPALMQLTGLDQFFRQRGMPEARINACLSDQAAVERLLAVTSRATNEEGVTATPTFFINGEKIEDAGTWQALETRLRGAMG